MAAIGDNKRTTFVVDQYHGTKIPLSSDGIRGMPWPARDFAALVTRSGSSEVIVVDYKPTIAPRTIDNDLIQPIPMRSRVGVTLHRAGGGTQRISVRFAQRRPNPVDAQKVCFLLPVALTQTDAVTLVHGQTAWKDCWITSVTCSWRPIVFANQVGSLQCAAVVTGSLEIQRPLDDSPIQAGDIEEPDPWPMTASLPSRNAEAQWWLIGPSGRVKLGRYADLESVEISRSSVLRTLPRLYGARLSTVGFSYTQVAQGFDGRRGRRCSVRMKAWYRSVEGPNGEPFQHGVSGSTYSHAYEIERQIEEFHQAVRDDAWWIVHHGIKIGPSYMTNFSVQKNERNPKLAIMNVEFVVDVSPVLETPATKVPSIAIS